MAKLMFSQKPEPILSVARNGITQYVEATASLNIIKKKQRK